MGGRLVVWLALSGMAVALLLARSADAESVVRPDTSVGAALRSLASRAEDVFVGQVVRVVRKGGVVEVEFRVDQSVMGTQGAEYKLREWAGVWPPGQNRYVVGERAMVFVYPLSACGLSSPVDGAEGVVPVMVQGVGEEPLLDVRRLATRVLRGQTEPLTDLESAAISLSEAAGVVRSWRELKWREPVRLPIPVKFRPVPVPILRGRVVSGEPPFVGSVEWERADAAR